jgi:exopolyphosphatase/guanosine-5'-triphosphate,3'-diphosphate pyrophosphatase
MLMFRGVTSERTLDGGTMIVDIGGGSTELVAGGPDGVRWHESLDIGSVRITERFLASDPPTASELDDASAAVRALLAERIPDEIQRDTRSAIGVAGTITSLAGLALGLAEYDRDRIHGFHLGAGALATQLERLASIPVDERRSLRPLDPDRAPVIVGGALIARELLAYFELAELEVSERDILDGAALAAAELPAEEEGAAPPGAYTCC